MTTITQKKRFRNTVILYAEKKGRPYEKNSQDLLSKTVNFSSSPTKTVDFEGWHILFSLKI